MTIGCETGGTGEGVSYQGSHGQTVRVGGLCRGIQRYKVNKYEDLDPLLGHNWHVRGINAAGDFCS